MCAGEVIDELTGGVVELCWVVSDGRSVGLNYYNIYNKDIGTDRIKVLFAGRAGKNYWYLRWYRCFGYKKRTLGLN